MVLAERLGVHLADEAEALMRGTSEPLEDELGLSEIAVSVPAKKMNRNLRELKPTRQCAWEPDGESEQPISLLNLGGMAIVGVKPELTYATDQAIKKGSPFRHTVIATLINGSAKYMADQVAYGKCMYEAQNSPFASGAAELLADAALTLLKGAMPHDD